MAGMDYEMKLRDSTLSESPADRDSNQSDHGGGESSVTLFLGAELLVKL